MKSIFLEGFTLQASLILALGAQNIFVLESGLKRNHHFLIAGLCIFFDFLLTFVGVWGAASVLAKYPSLKIIVGICGVGFLLFYAYQKIKEGLGGAKISFEKSGLLLSRKKAILMALSFTLLNPHVYLDTVFLIGGYSAKYDSFEKRTAFGLGAGSLSTLWFLGLVLISSFFNKLLHSKKAMGRISLVSGIILLSIGIKLGIEVYNWIRIG